MFWKWYFTSGRFQIFTRVMFSALRLNVCSYTDTEYQPKRNKEARRLYGERRTWNQRLGTFTFWIRPVCVLVYDLALNEWSKARSQPRLRPEAISVES